MNATFWNKVNELRAQGISKTTLPDEQGNMVEVVINRSGWYEGFY